MNSTENSFFVRRFLTSKPTQIETLKSGGITIEQSNSEIDCQKSGGTPKMSAELEELRREIERLEHQARILRATMKALTTYKGKHADAIAKTTLTHIENLTEFQRIEPTKPEEKGEE
jgi:hypothetical protein